MLTWIKRLVLTTVLLGLIASNLLTLTHSAFNAALSGLASAYLGVRTVTGALQGSLAAKDATIKKQKEASARQKKATKRFGTRLASRTKRVVGKSIAAIPAESVPFLGVAVIIADTGYEMYAACETMHDLEELYVSLGLPEQMEGDTLHSACNTQLPEPHQVWQGVVDQADLWWEDLVEAV